MKYTNKKAYKKKKAYKEEIKQFRITKFCLENVLKITILLFKKKSINTQSWLCYMDINRHINYNSKACNQTQYPM